MIYIKVTLLFLYSYFISLIFYYLCIIMFTIGINYQLYFPRIFRKINHKYNTRQKDDFHIDAIKSEIGKK